MKSKFDIGKVAVYVIAICSVLTVGALNTILKPWGMSDAAITMLSTRIGSIAAAAVLVTMVINTLKNPSPPEGTLSAVIPKGSVPVVAAAPGTGDPSVAVAAPETVLQVTPATQAPPQQIPPAP
jgi:uncharacterized protein (DUF58 family)